MIGQVVIGGRPVERNVCYMSLGIGFLRSSGSFLLAMTSAPAVKNSILVLGDDDLAVLCRVLGLWVYKATNDFWERPGAGLPPDDLGVFLDVIDEVEGALKSLAGQRAEFCKEYLLDPASLDDLRSFRVYRLPPALWTMVRGILRTSYSDISYGAERVHADDPQWVEDAAMVKRHLRKIALSLGDPLNDLVA